MGLTWEEGTPGLYRAVNVAEGANEDYEFRAWDGGVPDAKRTQNMEWHLSCELKIQGPPIGMAAVPFSTKRFRTKGRVPS